MLSWWATSPFGATALAACSLLVLGPFLASAAPTQEEIAAESAKLRKECEQLPNVYRPVLMDGSCFAVTDFESSEGYRAWRNMKTYCSHLASFPGRMATVNSKRLLDQLIGSNIVKVDEDFLVGGIQDPSDSGKCGSNPCSDEVHRKNWWFIDEKGNKLEPLNPELWRAGEPNNHRDQRPSENAVSLSRKKDSYGLNDMNPVTSKAKVLCQYTTKWKPSSTSAPVATTTIPTTTPKPSTAKTTTKPIPSTISATAVGTSPSPSAASELPLDDGVYMGTFKFSTSQNNYIGEFYYYSTQISQDQFGNVCESRGQKHAVLPETSIEEFTGKGNYDDFWLFGGYWESSNRYGWTFFDSYVVEERYDLPLVASNENSTNVGKMIYMGKDGNGKYKLHSDYGTELKAYSCVKFCISTDRPCMATLEKSFTLQPIAHSSVKVSTKTQTAPTSWANSVDGVFMGTFKFTIHEKNSTADFFYFNNKIPQWELLTECSKHGMLHSIYPEDVPMAQFIRYSNYDDFWLSGYSTLSSEKEIDYFLWTLGTDQQATVPIEALQGGVEKSFVNGTGVLVTKSSDGTYKLVGADRRLAKAYSCMNIRDLPATQRDSEAIVNEPSISTTPPSSPATPQPSMNNPSEVTTPTPLVSGGSTSFSLKFDGGRMVVHRTHSEIHTDETIIYSPDADNNIVPTAMKRDL